MIFIYALTLLTFQASALAQPETRAVTGQPAVLDQYRACVLAKAGALERSGEAAPTIADASLTACARLRIVLTVTDASGAPARSDDARAKNDDILKIIDNDLREQAVLKVVEDRAARAK